MSALSEAIWLGGPRACLLHRGHSSGIRRPGTSETCRMPRGSRCYTSLSSASEPHQAVRSPQQVQPPTFFRTARSQAEWKHRRRKPPARRAPVFSALQASTDVNPKTSISSKGSPIIGHAQLRPSHPVCAHFQLDRRRRGIHCLSGDDSSQAASSDDPSASVPSWSDAAAPAPPDHPTVRFAIDRDLEADEGDLDPQPSEAGILPETRLPAAQSRQIWPSRSPANLGPKLREVASAASSTISTAYASQAGMVYSPAQRSQIRESWSSLMRWSRVLRGRIENGTCPLERIDKVVVFGGGSFGTAMAAVLARQKAELHVILLLRDPYTCLSINHDHTNSRYLEVTYTTLFGEFKQLAGAASNNWLDKEYRHQSF